MEYTQDEKTLSGQLKTRHLSAGEYVNENLSPVMYFDDSVPADSLVAGFTAVAESLTLPEYVEGSAVEYSEVRVITSDYYRSYGE